MKVLIVGGEPTGSQLASLLIEHHVDVCVVEHRPEVLFYLHRELPTESIYEGQATDLKVLEDVGIQDTNVLVACTSKDADNLALCYLAKKLYRVPRTIGRINNPKHAWLFSEKFNVDVALNESSILAHLIEEEMSLGDMMTLLKLRRGEFSLIEVLIQEGVLAIGIAIKELSLPEQCIIVAVIRKGKMVLPRGATKLEVGDEVLAVTDASGAEQLAQLFTPPES